LKDVTGVPLFKYICKKIYLNPTNGSKNNWGRLMEGRTGQMAVGQTDIFELTSINMVF
jgi:hypothetical protein